MQDRILEGDRLCSLELNYNEVPASLLGLANHHGSGPWGQCLGLYSLSFASLSTMLSLYFDYYRGQSKGRPFWILAVELFC